MADILDVMNGLVAKCASSVYPGGTGMASVTGGLIKVAPGWPLPGALQADLARCAVNVSVFPDGPDRDVTRYVPKPQVMSIAPATLELSQAGQVITVGGAMPSPFTMHNMAVLINGAAYIYPVQAADTLTTIATGLSALIAVAFPGTTSAGVNITLPAGVVPTALRVGTSGVIATEWQRQQQRVRITVWAPDPTTRSQVATAIRGSLAQISFLTMPDGFGARVKPSGGTYSDALEKPGVFRFDLVYEIEYATTVIEEAATVVAVNTLVETQQGTPIFNRTF